MPVVLDSAFSAPAKTAQQRNMKAGKALRLLFRGWRTLHPGFLEQSVCFMTSWATYLGRNEDALSERVVHWRETDPFLHIIQ